MLDSTGTALNGDKLASLFDIRSESLDSTIEDYADTIDDMEYQLDKFEEGLVAKFSNLELLMGQLQAQGAAVDNLSSLNFGT